MKISQGFNSTKYFDKIFYFLAGFSKNFSKFLYYDFKNSPLKYLSNHEYFP